MSFFDRPKDLHQNGIALSSGSYSDSDDEKISTNISHVAIDRAAPESFNLSEVIIKGVRACLKNLQGRPLFIQYAP